MAKFIQKKWEIYQFKKKVNMWVLYGNVYCFTETENYGLVCIFL